MRIVSWMLIAALPFAVGCSKGKKNAQACEDWIAATSCGTTDFSTLVDCSVYEELKCDVADYFTCLTDNTTCTDDVPDMTGWADCADKAVCE